MSKPNTIKALVSLTKFTFLATLRNPSALFFGFLFPLIFIIVFGLLGQGSSKFDIGVVSDSVKSGTIYETLTKVDAFNLVTNKSDSELEDQLSKGQIPVIINIKVNKELSPELKTYTVEIKTTSASQNSQTVKSIIESITTGINAEANKVLNPNAIEIATVKTSNVEGRKYSQIDFILPGQLNFSLLTTGVFTMAFSMLTLRQTLVLKRMFATPTPKWIILAAKVLSSMIIAVLQSLLIIGFGYFAFGFTLVNGIVTIISMVGLAVLGLIVFLGLGLLVTALATSEDAASPIANLITMPQFLLSGTFFSIDAFPEFLKPIAQIMPMKYLNDAMRAIAFEGASFQQILPQIIALLVIGAIVYIVVIKLFKWE